MQDLENNNWIILDPWENIYEIYANLTVMTLLNLNLFWTTREHHIFKSEFHVCYHFLKYFWKSQEKNFINPSCPKHPKIINWNKKWHKFIFSHFFVVQRKRFMKVGRPSSNLYEAPKRSVKIKNLCHRPPPPLFGIGTARVKTVCRTLVC